MFGTVLTKRVVLSEIAEITTGVYEKESREGDVKYLHSRHFNEFGNFLKNAPVGEAVSLDDRIVKHVLKDGDILLVAKGSTNKACLYESGIGPSVASSIFLVIRLKEKQLMPAFVQWYLNTQAVQIELSGISRGTQIASLPKKSLESMELPIPPLREQVAITRFQKFWEKEQQLTAELLALKDKFYQHSLLSTIK